MVGYRKVNGNDSEVKKRGLMDKVRGVHDGLSDRIPQQHKDTAHNHLNRGNQFLIFPWRASRWIQLPRQEGNTIHFFMLFSCWFSFPQVIIERQKHNDY